MYYHCSPWCPAINIQTHIQMVSGWLANANNRPWVKTRCLSTVSNAQVECRAGPFMSRRICSFLFSRPPLAPLTHRVLLEQILCRCPDLFSSGINRWHLNKPWGSLASWTEKLSLRDHLFIRGHLSAVL